MSGAENGELFLHAARVLGARRTLRKPFSASILLHAVNQALAEEAARAMPAPLT